MAKRLLLVSLLLCAGALFAAVIEGITFSETMDVGGRKLVLNGTGLRLKRVIINIKVYAAGLYLEQKESNPQKILNDDKAKVLKMHFIYSNVGKDKLKEAFTEGFEGNGGAGAKKMESQIDKFISFWPDMAENDEAQIIYVPGIGTKVVIKGKEAGTIEGNEFGKLVFSVWLGPKPPNEELKTGLLGR
jgi:hypothetical protein